MFDTLEVEKAYYLNLKLVKTLVSKSGTEGDPYNTVIYLKQMETRWVLK